MHSISSWLSDTGRAIQFNVVLIFAPIDVIFFSNNIYSDLHIVQNERKIITFDGKRFSHLTILLDNVFSNIHCSIGRVILLNMKKF